MAQQSILGRIGQLLRANVNSLIDQAEDPEKMLDQIIRDYAANIGEAEQAIAQTIGNLRMTEEDAQEADTAAREWGQKAAAASRKAEQLRTGGASAEAAKFDDLARVALKRQIDFEGQVRTFTPTIEEQTKVVAQLKTGLEQMRDRLDRLRHKRDELVSRAKTAQAQAQIQDAVRAVDLMDPTSEVGRFEEKIRREEARVRGQAELSASSLDAQFEALDEAADEAEIEARLAALKTGTG